MAKKRKITKRLKNFRRYLIEEEKYSPSTIKKNISQG